MSNIKKINGHNLKDELVRSRLNAMIESIDIFQRDVDEVKEILDTFLKGDTSDIYEQVTTNTNDIKELKELINSGGFTPGTATQPKATLTLKPTYTIHNMPTNVTVSPSFTQNAGGAFIKYELYKNGTLYTTKYNVSDLIEVTNLSNGDSVTYKLIIYYDASDSLAAGTVETSATIKGYAYSYYGVIDGDFDESLIPNLTQKVYTSKTNTLSYNLVNQRSIYMYPSNLGKLTSIRDDNNFNYISSYTLYTITYEEVEYYVYVLTDEVTIENFTQKFS